MKNDIAFSVDEKYNLMLRMFYSFFQKGQWENEMFEKGNNRKL